FPVRVEQQPVVLVGGVVERDVGLPDRVVSSAVLGGARRGVSDGGQVPPRGGECPLEGGVQLRVPVGHGVVPSWTPWGTTAPRADVVETRRGRGQHVRDEYVCDQ